MGSGRGKRGRRKKLNNRKKGLASSVSPKLLPMNTTRSTSGDVAEQAGCEQISGKAFAEFGVLSNLLAFGVRDGSMLCQSEKLFARSLDRAGNQTMMGYCTSAFKDRTNMSYLCYHVLKNLTAVEGVCNISFVRLIHL